MILTLYLLILFGLAFIGLPVAFSLGFSTLLYVQIGTRLPLTIVFQRMLAGIDSFPFMAIPFFMLAGMLMNEGGLNRRILEFSRALVGHLWGGLSAVSIVGSMIFAGISGSSVADASGLGSILIPAMKKEGYDPEFAASINAVSSTVGIIIPPSIPMILAGVATALSIRDLFLGGAIPGILVGLGMLVISTMISKKRKYPKYQRVTFKELFKIFLKTLPALVEILIILGGILGGIFTPTEASVIAVVYAFVLGKFVYREIKLKNLFEVFKQVAISSAIVLFIISTASAVTWVLAYSRLPQLLADMLPSLFPTPTTMLIALGVLFLIAGTFIDVSPGVILFGPILLPAVKAVGVDPVHFTVIMVFALAIGLFTPPVGTTLFISCYLAKTEIMPTVKESMLFFIEMVAILFLIILLPQLVMFLPSLAR
ncbi:MAG TPA: TRAP transporter large permease [Thermotogaceae bacterium]|nr:TRAP transporter large permease [Thermotogaceae bacterium]